ncbi:MAG TPA: hypothetical protein VJS69_11460 [Candidatus Krumholzibacteria bacterium]|nr:hypothetical protein [Candidatus Krumholzibacteria bacterium]
MSASHNLTRALAYTWSFPNTLLGIVLAAPALLTGGRAAVVNGVLEVHGGAASFLLRHLVLLRGGASAMTLGHVILGRDPESLNRTRDHERVHVTQYETWGPLFLPAYALASLLAVARGRHYYRDNPFERTARSGKSD